MWSENGICGQGPSDYPDFAQFLVEEGIDSISFTPDSVIKQGYPCGGESDKKRIAAHSHNQHEIKGSTRLASFQTKHSFQIKSHKFDSEV